MLGRVVFLVVDTHHHGDVFLLGRGGNDHFLGAGLEVTLGFGRLGEKSGALEDNVHAEFFPGERGRALLDREAFDFLTVNHEHVVLGGGRR